MQRDELEALLSTAHEEAALEKLKSLVLSEKDLPEQLLRILEDTNDPNVSYQAAFQLHTLFPKLEVSEFGKDRLPVIFQKYVDDEKVLGSLKIIVEREIKGAWPQMVKFLNTLLSSEDSSKCALKIMPHLPMHFLVELHEEFIPRLLESNSALSKSLPALPLLAFYASMDTSILFTPKVFKPWKRFFSQLSSKPLDLVIKIELVRCLTLLPVRLNWPKKVDSNAFVKVHAKDVLDYVLLILNSSDAKELQFNHFVPVLTAYLSQECLWPFLKPHLASILIKNVKPAIVIKTTKCEIYTFAESCSQLRGNDILPEVLEDIEKSMHLGSNKITCALNLLTALSKNFGSLKKEATEQVEEFLIQCIPPLLRPIGPVRNTALVALKSTIASMKVERATLEALSPLVYERVLNDELVNVSITAAEALRMMVVKSQSLMDKSQLLTLLPRIFILINALQEDVDELFLLLKSLLESYHSMLVVNNGVEVAQMLRDCLEDLLVREPETVKKRLEGVFKVIAFLFLASFENKRRTHALFTFFFPIFDRIIKSNISSSYIFVNRISKHVLWVLKNVPEAVWPWIEQMTTESSVETCWYRCDFMEELMILDNGALIERPSLVLAIYRFTLETFNKFSDGNDAEVEYYDSFDLPISCASLLLSRFLIMNKPNSSSPKSSPSCILPLVDLLKLIEEKMKSGLLKCPHDQVKAMELVLAILYHSPALFPKCSPSLLSKLLSLSKRFTRLHAIKLFILALAPLASSFPKSRPKIINLIKKVPEAEEKRAFLEEEQEGWASRMETFDWRWSSYEMQDWGDELWAEDPNYKSPLEKINIPSFLESINF